MADREPASVELEQQFSSWLESHRRIDVQVSELVRDYLRIDVPSSQNVHGFHQLLCRLQERLAVQFEQEADLVELLAACKGRPTLEIEATRRQSLRDGRRLQTRLEALCGQVHQQSVSGRLDVAKWQTGLREFNLLVDLIEQHEEQEQASIAWLKP